MSLKITEPPRLIGPHSSGMPMSIEDFDTLPESRWILGYRYELIDGVLIVSPPPDAGERGPNELLGILLWQYQETHPEGRCIDETLPEQTIETPTNRRRADRAIWVGLGRVPNFSTDFPPILVEFVSSTRQAFLRDYEIKRDEYLASGVREYWVIDRFRETLTVFRPALEGRPTDPIVESTSYQTPLLPGFVLPLDRLFAKARRLS